MSYNIFDTVCRWISHIWYILLPHKRKIWLVHLDGIEHWKLGQLVGQRDSIHELLIRLKRSHWIWWKAHLQINASSSFVTWIWGHFPIKLVCIPTAKCHCFPHSKFIPIHVEPGWTPHHYTVWIKKPSRLENNWRLQPGINRVTHNFVSVVDHSLVQLPCHPPKIVFKQFTSCRYSSHYWSQVPKVIIR